MIYLFSGDDAKAKRTHLEKMRKAKSFPAEVFSIHRNNFDRLQIESLYSGAGLFFEKCAVIFENILEDKEIKDFILDKIRLMQESENLFIFLEGKLDKATTDVFKKAKAESEVFDLPKVKVEKFNSFLLANDFGARDKLNLWIHFRQAIQEGIELEALVGILFWKMKDMILKRNFSKFSEKELQNLSARMSYLLPEARRDGRDTEAALEQFLLEAV